ncbi:MAG TPA: prepilin-type N-terminal cleavage/methylation domain-containing protein, partial [Steroidobacteraceae bacterium]|nr:prepilin-type N-terminal cleavage/methylation domain-containing protein [Steroidobacteraceae bacterium]
MKTVMQPNYGRSVPVLAVRRAHGVSLVELMVAMTLGLVMVAGAANVYVGGRHSHDANESIARMQESAR